jgi:hypothetical protein
MKKIIIFGFPHCGTTILKNILGHIDDVEEIYNETDVINESAITTSKKYILCKCPFTYPKFFSEKYNEYIKIFIIRNPLWAFSSLNKRFQYKKLSKGHSIEDYINTIKYFNYYKHNNNKNTNLHLIRYEDIFENNYKMLKDILDTIGFEYTDNIFNNENYTNIHHTSIIESLIDKPKNKDHWNYRTWQINKSFVNNNDISKIDLSPEQIYKMQTNFYINNVYPNILTKNVILNTNKIKNVPSISSLHKMPIKIYSLRKKNIFYKMF